MHEENGIVYSDNPEKLLTVLEVRHLYSGVYPYINLDTELYIKHHSLYY